MPCLPSPSGAPRSRAALLLAALLLAALPARRAAALALGPVVDLASGVPSAGQRAASASWLGGSGAAGWLVVYEDDRNQASGSGRDLYFSVVAPNGTSRYDASLLPSSWVRISAAGDQTTPRVVSAPTSSYPDRHLIAWRDGRGGASRIFATDFALGRTLFSARSPLEVSGPPTRVSLAPALAEAGAAHLVAFQVARAGATPEIWATRIDGLRVGSGPIRWARSATRPSAAGLGGRFFVAQESSLGVAQIGAASSSGPLAAPRTTAVTTATGAESGVQAGLLGQDLFVVWEDTRNATRDVYARRFDPVSLLPRGPDVPIVTAAGAQRAPRFASSSGSGLVVWREDRAASGARLHGVRVDGTGAVRDAQAFSVLASSGQAVLETELAAGPGGAYLLLAVRAGSPPRLVGRVLRDEGPARPLELISTTAPTAEADGVDVASARLRQPDTADGFAFADGTLYDVTLSSPRASFATPDADPGRSGHQAALAGGVVSVGLTSRARGRVTIEFASVEGSATGREVALFRNAPPTASEARISPDRPSSVDDLTLRYTYRDPNGDPEAGSEIRWTRDGQLQTNLQSSLVVPAASTTRGERWRASIRPRDGDAFGAIAWAPEVVIRNAPPSATDARIRAASDPAQTGDSLTLSYRFRDPDGDPEGATRIEWLEARRPVPALEGARSVPGALVEKGQRWRAVITPSDGDLEGAPVSTATLTVQNTPPSARVEEVVLAVERARVRLDATASSDPDPTDVLQFRWRQTEGPTVTLSATTTARPELDAPVVEAGARLAFTVEVSDGEAASEATVFVSVRPDADTDGDGLDDGEERALGIDPARSDTDGDGLLDGAELEAGLDPLDADTDDDGVADGDEGRACPTCPADPRADSNGDGVLDAASADADGDGLDDGLELGRSSGIDARVLDGFEIEGTGPRFVPDLDPASTTDPTRADSDGDGLLDGEEDANGNGRLDPNETDPANAADPCRGDGDCGPGLVCEAGACVPETPECATDDDCPDGRCAEGRCVDAAECRPLPDAFECCAGGCRPEGRPVPAECEPGAERATCAGGAELCDVGLCVGAAPPPASNAADAEGGCRCGRPTPPGWALLLLAGLLLVRRRAPPEARP